VFFITLGCFNFEILDIWGMPVGLSAFSITVYTSIIFVIFIIDYLDRRHQGSFIYKVLDLFQHNLLNFLIDFHLHYLLHYLKFLCGLIFGGNTLIFVINSFILSYGVGR
jgi:hypothetical protein